MVETFLEKGGGGASPLPMPMPSAPKPPLDPNRLSNAGTNRKKVGIDQTILSGLNLGSTNRGGGSLLGI